MSAIGKPFAGASQSLSSDRGAYELIGAPLSLYSGKARAYLRWKGVQFSERLSTRDVYQNEILPKIGWPVIPVLIDPDGVYVQDTSAIIDHVEAAVGGASVYPDGPVQKLAALLLELYGDEWLVLPAMLYRWRDNEDWVYGEFGRTAAPDATPEEQMEIGRSSGQRFKSTLPILGVTDDTIPGVEAHYEGFLADFSAHLRQHPFLFGSRPSIGDFGLIGPLYAHLYRDPASGELMKRLAPEVAEWVERCHWPPEPLLGEFLGDDLVPDTLLPILARQMAEQLPSLLESYSAFVTWADGKSYGEQMPRALGAHAFSIGGREGERASLTFSLWMLQRALDHYWSLEGEDRLAADAFLDQIGASVLTTLQWPRRLDRLNHKLCLTD
ncbi:MAG: glutathione S-transferase family protein [Pseudomonadota bacterium]